MSEDKIRAWHSRRVVVARHNCCSRDAISPIPASRITIFRWRARTTTTATWDGNGLAYSDRFQTSMSDQCRMPDLRSPCHSVFNKEIHDSSIRKWSDVGGEVVGSCLCVSSSGNCDKLLRSDMYYTKPKLALSNNSVKYNIINNRVNKFMYS